MLEQREAWEIDSTRRSLACLQSDCLAMHRNEALRLVALVETLDAENKEMLAELERLRGVRRYGN